MEPACPVIEPLAPAWWMMEDPTCMKKRCRCTSSWVMGWVDLSASVAEGSFTSKTIAHSSATGLAPEPAARIV